MNNQKKYVVCAVGMVLALLHPAAHAIYYYVWSGIKLGDFDGDGLQSDFTFNSPPTGSGLFIFGASNEDCGGYPCVEMRNNSGPMGVDQFTTGFNFQGGGDFQPTIFGYLSFTLDRQLAALGDGQALQFSALDFGGVYQNTTNFQLSPDHLINCTGAIPGVFSEGCGATSRNDNPALSNPEGYNVEITQLTNIDYGVVIRFVSTIQGEGATLPYDGDEANFRLEGIISGFFVPVPAAVWLFGSGLLGLFGMSRGRKSRQSAE